MKKSYSNIFTNKQFILSVLMLIVICAGIVNGIRKRTQDQALQASVNLDQYIMKSDENNTPSPQSTEHQISSGSSSSDGSAKDSGENLPEYFAQAKLDRENARSKSLSILGDIVKNEQSSKEEKSKAQEQMTKIAEAVEAEAVIEALIKAKGFDHTVVYISESGVSVIVKSSGITQAQVAQIKDIVMEKTGETADKIKIIETN